MVQQGWTKIQLFLLYTVGIFVLLFVATTSDFLQWLPTLWLHAVAEAFVKWSAVFFFGQDKAFYSPISSDSLGLVIHCFNLLLLSVGGGLLFLFGGFGRCWDADKLYYGLRTFLSYYIALQLLLYGFNKVFKCQFYLPEPNTLYTTIGATPKDLLFWSVMGSAYGYTVFAGVLEVLAAILLLFRKTRLVGALLASILLIHILAINLGFNISVKLYAFFYWLFTGIILLPHIKRLYAFLIENKWLAPTDWQPAYKKLSARLVYASIKTMVVGLLLLKSLYPYFKANNFNDDLQARPPFHGAYQVESFVQDKVNYPDRIVHSHRWNKAFVHRRGYFVVHYMNGETQDYQFAYDIEKGLFELIHTQTQNRSLLEYFLLSDGSLQLKGNLDGKPLEVFLQKLDWQSLPLLQKEFYWTIDQINPR